MWKSSNPILTKNDVFDQVYGKDMFAAKANVTTVGGVVNKTGLLVLVAVVCGAGGYSVQYAMPSAVMISSIAALIVGLGLFFVLRGKPTLAPFLAPVYAIVEGFFLGAVTALADEILARQGIAVAGGVGLQAFIITASALIAMLVLYRARILRPTKTFQAVLATATGAIMLAYLATFVVGLVFGKTLPLIGFASAVQESGWMGFLGLGINVLILLVASFWLVVDFKLVEDAVGFAAPKYMEWYCGFALLVTLAWVYFEAVKLVIRLAVLFGSRD